MLLVAFCAADNVGSTMSIRLCVLAKASLAAENVTDGILSFFAREKK